MPPNRGKWPSNRGKSSRGRPAAARARMRQPFFPTTTAMDAASEGFSMRDEARNTASHQSALACTSGDAKLRQKPVTFVSAGLAEPLKEDKKRGDDAADSNIVEESTGDAVAAAPGAEDAAGHATTVIDVVEIEATLETVARAISANQHSAEEGCACNTEQQAEVPEGEAKELFFFDLGDGEPALQPSLPPPQIPSPRSSVGDSDSSEEVILFRGRSANAHGTAEYNKVSRTIPTAGPSTEPSDPGSETLAVISNRPDLSRSTPSSEPFRKRTKSQRKHSRAPTADVDDEEDDENAILADYISNIAANPDDDFLVSQLQALSTHRDLGGDGEAINFGSSNEKSPMGDCSLDDGSTESLGSGVSDAEREVSVNRSDGQDMDVDMDMDDETLARLLAKQEEIDMGGDELLLFASSSVHAESHTTRGNRPAIVGPRQSSRARVSASQVADAFDSLDLADWGHLTGQTRKRRSKQPPNFDVSDSEIEATLRASWQRDRERKKNRKLERETRRAEGLLDKNADPSDLRVKYPSGMKLDDMKTELTSFLLGTSERLDFPPLDKHARKVLHELASKFNVKSQSTGKGDQRRPVLYRTNRTVRYASTRVQDAASHVEQASLRIHRKYFHRVDVKVQRTESPRMGGSGRSGHKALTLREGEVVGASVPELGQENKGRTMLEKMGWSKGMALGSLDNQGILEPVAQVMKRSKAGLG